MVAWLSVRLVSLRCWVKSQQAPIWLVCQRVSSGTLVRLPVTNPEEGEDDVKSSALTDLGDYTRATMDGTTSSGLARDSESLKAILSSVVVTQLDYI